MEFRRPRSTNIVSHALGQIQPPREGHSQASTLPRPRPWVSQSLPDSKWQVENGSSGVILGDVQQSAAIPQGMSEDRFVFADQFTPLMLPD